MNERSVSDIIQGRHRSYTARCPEFKPKRVCKLQRKMYRIGLDGIVVIGGDGSFRGAADLSERESLFALPELLIRCCLY